MIKKILAASVFNTGVLSIINIIQFPILLTFWSAEVLGSWLLLYTIIQFFQQVDLGFSVTIGNRSKRAQGCDDGSIGGNISCVLVLYVVMLFASLILNEMGLFSQVVELNSENIESVNYFILISFFILVNSINTARLRSQGYLDFAVNLSTCSRVLEFTALIFVAILELEIKAAAITLCLIKLLELYISSKKLHHLGLAVFGTYPIFDIGFFSSSVKFSIFSFSFMILNVVPIVLINNYIGTEYVAVFVISRTIARAVIPIVNNVNLHYWECYKVSENYSSLFKAITRNCTVNGLMMLTFLSFLGLFGEWVFSLASAGKIGIQKELLFLLSCGVLFYALWSPISGVFIVKEKSLVLALLYGASISLALVIFIYFDVSLTSLALYILVSEIVMLAFSLFLLFIFWKKDGKESLLSGSR